VRRIAEAVARRLYFGDWPAKVWARAPVAPVRAVRLELPILPAGMPRLRLGFASDLHIGPVTPIPTLERAFALLNDAQPDVLLLGGDYVYLDASAAKADVLRRLVASVAAPLKLAVLGNHDLWTRHDRLESALAEAGARVLVNEVVRLADPHGGVVILGVDDPRCGRPDPEAVLRASEGATVRIVLVHRPDGMFLFEDAGIDLLLCGHSHGGQIALPGGRPITVPGTGSRRWPHGLHRVGTTYLHVSRGVGAVELPIRAFAPPDVVIADLVPRAPP
jgi:hypothetical protein